MESDGEVRFVEALSKDRKYVTREICHVLDADDATEANLRLIALAPEMFDTLEGIVVNMDKHDVVDESWWEYAREIIAKVRATTKRRKTLKCSSCGERASVVGQISNGLCRDCDARGGK